MARSATQLRANAISQNFLLSNAKPRTLQPPASNSSLTACTTPYSTSENGSGIVRESASEYGARSSDHWHRESPLCPGDDRVG